MYVCMYRYNVFMNHITKWREMYLDEKIVSVIVVILCYS